MSSGEMGSGTQTLQIRRESVEPIHAQIAAHFRQMIRTGMWPRSHRLQSEADLAESFGVARGTVRRAIGTLVDEGLLIQVHGRGTFVSPRDHHQQGQSSIGSLISNGEALRAQGIEYTTDLLDRTVAESGRADGPFPGGRVLKLRRRRSLMGGPEAVVDSEVSLAALPLAEQLTEEQLTTRPLHTLLKSECGADFAWAERVFSAERAPAEIAELLGVEPGSPLLGYQQFTYDGAGDCVESSYAWTRTDRRRHAVTIKEPT